ncbi:MAG: hypothetical protein K9G41_08520 [Flavobacteriales bacterium]|nr:hypothetical protein [Flavobacteriales bacterium]
MRFSQKIGKKSVRESIQIESIDQVLENRLWNNFLIDFMKQLSSYRSYSGGASDQENACQTIWEEFYEERADEIPSRSGDVYVDGVIRHVKTWFFEAAWYEKYDFIEFISLLGSEVYRTEFTEKCNRTLKNESAGYRIIDHSIVQITSEVEISAIEEAIYSSSKMKSVEIHLRTALEFLSNRESPDYRNSIKESISAVESFCSIMTGNDKATLGEALSQIEKTHNLHGALKKAFSSLYGYTSDSGGIRHSLLEDDISVSMEEAKFMLVSCSAFINYLNSKN